MARGRSGHGWIISGGKIERRVERVIWRDLEFPKHNEHEASARGRNGLFDPRKVEVTKEEHGGYNSVAVNVFSKREDGAPPIRLRLPAAEWLKIAEAVKEIAEKGG